jgi:hypothetical protein
MSEYATESALSCMCVSTIIRVASLCRETLDRAVACTGGPKPLLRPQRACVLASCQAPAGRAGAGNQGLRTAQASVGEGEAGATPTSPSFTSAEGSAAEEEEEGGARPNPTIALILTVLRAVLRPVSAVRWAPRAVWGDALRPFACKRVCGVVL